jgi:hypothetical protein
MAIRKAQTGDTILKKPPLTYAEKRAAQQIVKERNIRARDSVLNRQASAQGRSRDEMRSFQKSIKNKPDQQVEGLNIAGANKRGDSKGSCTTGVKNQGESLKDTKRNGGSVKAKDGKWIQKATASIKKRGTAGKCTPISKPGCSGKAKTLALTFKKMSKAKKKK